MQANEDLVRQIKLESLRRTIAEGERDLEAGRYRTPAQDEIGPFMHDVRDRARERIKKESL